MSENINRNVASGCNVMDSNYLTFRGKCKEYVDALVSKNPELRAVRGHYYCPIWNTFEPHWWAVDATNKIIDPTAKQFPSQGLGEYTEFDGIVSCSECGKEGDENDFTYESNYVFCSGWCYGRFVGVL